MGIFNNVLRADQTLFKSEESLAPEFVPKLLPFREGEQKRIASCIAPLLNNRNGRNAFIVGAPGIGKTAACKHILRELEEESDEIHTIYINCWQRNTTYKILLGICEELNYAFTQNKKTDELSKIAAEIINKKAAVLVFDELDKCDDHDFLYTLLEDLYKKSIICITNYRSALLNLDERIKSRLIPEILNFKEYNAQETHHILKERTTYAFFDGVWTSPLLQRVADKTTQLKDIRTGLFLLKEAGLQAEETQAKQVTDTHIQTALTKLDQFTIKSSADLEEDEQFILSLVKESPGKKIGDLYRLYQSKGGKSSYKTFQRRISKLGEGHYVSLEKTHTGGTTTIVNKKITDYTPP
ncbi:hypothetical protein CMO92_03400 [Candidatus Woesearchaeota archaeon]|nr:hypothetical protein [Candidatus Woesearchaeota archaeon]